MARGNIDWPKIKTVLGRLAQTVPEFLDDNALIGGAACAFYREWLKQQDDGDFKLKETPEERELWLSRDIDFLGQKKDEYERALGTPPQGNPPKYYIENTWVDTPDSGLTMDAERCLNEARPVSTEVDGAKVAFLVADPLMLYREKLALTRQPFAREQDQLHTRALRETLALEMVKELEKNLSLSEARRWRHRAQILKEIDPAFHLDNKWRRRVHKALEKMKEAPGPIKSYVKHHIAPPEKSGRQASDEMPM